MSDAIKPLTLALFGLGRIGQIHIKNIIANRRIQLTWVVEENQEVAKSVLTSYRVANDVRVATTGEIGTVLKDDSLDAVFICTPTDTHADLTIQALKAGKHVMCEKPMSEETAKIKECYDVAEECGKVLLAAFNRKFDASYRDIYQKVRSGGLGKLHMLRSTMRDSPLWLGAKSFTQTFLCHDIDMLCWMAGETPDSVVTMASANIQEVADKDDVDTVVVTMKFPSGSIGILDFSRYSCYGYDIRLEVYGSNGMLKMEPAVQNDVHSYTASGTEAPPMKNSFPDRFGNAYVAELDHFVDVIEGKAELFVPREQCERASIVNDAVKRSYELGEIVYLGK